VFDARQAGTLNTALFSVHDMTSFREHFSCVPVHFGLCHKQIDGNIVFDARKAGTLNTALFYVHDMRALTVKGGGTLDGNGKDWWGLGTSSRPDMLLVASSSNVEISGLTSK